MRILPGTSTLRRRGALGAMLLLLWSIFAAQPVLAQEAAVSEEQLKAAFLYNFARFVEWPHTAFENENSPIVLGVLGNDAFANTLTTLLKEKKAHNRSFVVKKLSGVNDVAGAQIVFVAKEESKKTAQIADLVREKPVLLVGESDDFLDNGGIINVLMDKKQLVFNIHVAHAEQHKLVVSSHLLRLSRNNEPKKSEGTK
jgi:hypothetical protein